MVINEKYAIPLLHTNQLIVNIQHILFYISLKILIQNFKLSVYKIQLTILDDLKKRMPIKRMV